MASTRDDGQFEHGDDSAHEATELVDYDNASRNRSINVSLARVPRASHDGRCKGYCHSLHKSVKSFWQQQVAATVTHGSCRDHYGTYSPPTILSLWNCATHDPLLHILSTGRLLYRGAAVYLLLSLVALERTFLGYMRTSLALSMLAVLVAQLFRLQHTVNPSKTLGYFVIGTPLACVCIVAAIIVLLLGAYRFWRQQNAMLRGKVHAGGWEIFVVSVTVFLVCYSMNHRGVC